MGPRLHSRPKDFQFKDEPDYPQLHQNEVPGSLCAKLGR